MDGFDWACNRAMGGVALDIGANNGGISRLLSKKMGEVHAFEPTPFMFKELELVAKESGGVIRPINKGVGAEPKVVRNVRVHHAWTIVENGPKNDVCSYDGNTPFDMELTTIDEWSRARGGDPVDFIKLDVDGYEFDVLKGGALTLAKDKPPIMFEYSYMPERFLGQSPKEMVEFIYGLGYRAWSMDLKYCCETADRMLSHYPAHTSFDIMLIHSGTIIQ